MKRSIIEYLEQSASKYPNKVYIADEARSVTFKETEEIAKRIGSYLSSRYIKKNKPIAVWVGRDVESILMFLGVVYSGNFYVPLNRSLPKERVKIILEALQPKAVLGRAEDSERTEDAYFPFYDFQEMIKAEVLSDIITSIAQGIIDTDPLYAIFTSGSTGTPKAVLVGHRSVMDLAEAFRDAFSIDENSICGNQAQFDFDISIKDIYSGLLNGCTVYIIPKEMFSFPVNLISYLNDKKITHCFWAVASLCLVCNLKGMKKIDRSICNI